MDDQDKHIINATGLCSTFKCRLVKLCMIHSRVASLICSVLGLLWAAHAACLQIRMLTSKTKNCSGWFSCTNQSIQTAESCRYPESKRTCALSGLKDDYTETTWNSQSAPVWLGIVCLQSHSVPRGLGLAAAEMDCIVQQVCKGHTVEPAPDCDETDKNCEKDGGWIKAAIGSAKASTYIFPLEFSSVTWVRLR